MWMKLRDLSAPDLCHLISHLRLKLPYTTFSLGLGIVFFTRCCPVYGRIKINIQASILSLSKIFSSMEGGKYKIDY